jgi:hypothetical protein
MFIFSSRIIVTLLILAGAIVSTAKEHAPRLVGWIPLDRGRMGYAAWPLFGLFLILLMAEGRATPRWAAHSLTVIGLGGLLGAARAGTPEGAAFWLGVMATGALPLLAALVLVVGRWEVKLVRGEER